MQNHFPAQDLGGVIGLESVVHRGPSSIGIDTFFNSSGKIPQIFLRGCGVPDTFLDYASSLTCKPFELCSCFIAYSPKDLEFAQRVYNDLQSKGVRCWLSPGDTKLEQECQGSSLLRYNFSVPYHHLFGHRGKLLLILSEDSSRSDWVEIEVELAMRLEHYQKLHMLCPVRLDDFVMEIDTDWAAEIRRAHHIGDFTKWKDDNFYQKALERLLQDLKAKGEPKA